MKNLLEEDFIQLLLLRHCDNRKVHYCRKNNIQAEKFSYLELKVGMMAYHIAMSMIEEKTYGSKVTYTYQKLSATTEANVKIKEIWC